jgi:hypothetical protein
VSDSAVTVAQAILRHSNIRAVPASTEGLLDSLGAEIGTTPLADINYDWTEQWISALEREKHLAPGTIRKKKGALSRVLDWVARAHPLWLSANPLHSSTILVRLTPRARPVSSRTRFLKRPTACGAIQQW